MDVSFYFCCLTVASTTPLHFSSHLRKRNLWQKYVQVIEVQNNWCFSVWSSMAAYWLVWQHTSADMYFAEQAACEKASVQWHWDGRHDRCQLAERVSQEAQTPSHQILQTGTDQTQKSPSAVSRSIAFNLFQKSSITVNQWSYTYSFLYHLVFTYRHTHRFTIIFKSWERQKQTYSGKTLHLSTAPQTAAAVPHVITVCHYCITRICVHRRLWISQRQWSKQQPAVNHKLLQRGPGEWQPPLRRTTRTQIQMTASRKQRRLTHPRQKSFFYALCFVFKQLIWACSSVPNSQNCLLKAYTKSWLWAL